MKRVLSILILLTLLFCPLLAENMVDAQKQKNEALRREIHRDRDTAIEAVTELLAQGADPNSADEDGNTAAHYAARYLYGKNAATILPMLAEAGCRFDVLNNEGETPLSRAGLYSREKTKFILEWEQKNNSRFSGKYEDRKTYIANIFSSALSSTGTVVWGDSDDLAFVENLIKAGEPIDGIDEQGRNLAWYIAGMDVPNESKQSYDIQILKLLIDKGLRFDIADKDGITPLYRTVRVDQHWTNPRPEFFHLVLEWEQKHNPSFSGAKENRAEYLSVALESVVDLRNRQETLIALLKEGADWRILTEEVEGELILKRRRDIIDFDYFLALLNYGMPPNIRDKEGRTYLARASESHIIETLLLDYGADPTIADNKGNTVLHRHYIKERALLVEKGADINAKNNDGYTPLMENIGLRSGSMYNKVKEFLDLGADPLQKTPDGKNILHLYLEKYTPGYVDDAPDPQVVKLLLDCGIDPTEQDDKSVSALGLAIYISKKKDNKDVSEVNEIITMMSESADKKEISAANKEARQVRRETSTNFVAQEIFRYSMVMALPLSYLAISIALREGSNNNSLEGINTFTSGFVIGTIAGFTPFLLAAISAGGLDGLGSALLGVIVAPAVGIITGALMASNSSFKNGFTYYAGAVAIPLFIMTWMF